MAYKDPHDPRAREARRRHYEKNRQAYKDNAKAARARLQGIVREMKEGPCVDCGGRFHFMAMEFDHLPGYEKVADIAMLVRNGSERILREEIAKCELVCANCHRVRTWGRMQD